MAQARVLIANRGEIAIRVARAASGLGFDSVGVFAPVDALSLHTRVVTEAREIGAGAADPVAAYLDGDTLVRLALETGCELIHPGYGFLSESAAFAEAAAAAGLTFVGPAPAALRLFGDKTQARSLAASLGLPVVPGSPGTVGSPEEAAAWAEELGYPVMLKAAAGGGGRGIRLVSEPAAMTEAFERCRSEAAAAFGDGGLFVERVLRRPRHIEVQILADADGNTVHLYERDCSVQLRNQKVVEVAPAAGLDESLRQRILDDAVRLARAATYVNAGTLEFLVVPETADYFFIEGNPRIQVEHTVTEQITGIDLVEAQLRIATGASLTALGLGDQAAVGRPRGYAVQARVVATGTGTISGYREPSGPGVRVDSCGYVGYAPPPQFDPLLAKVICSSPAGAPLGAAVDRARRALDEFHLAGLPTNIGQLRAILSAPEVSDGQARTSWLTDSPEVMTPPAPPRPTSEAVSFLDERAAAGRNGAPAGRNGAPAGPRGTPARPATATASRPDLSLLVDGHHGVECPMASALVEFRVSEGDGVVEGDAVFVVSAMKMETVVLAPCSGVVTSLQTVEPGAELAAGEILAVIDPHQDRAAAARATDGADPWDDVLRDIRDLQNLAAERLAPGSEEPGVVRQRSRGKLTCRERITLLLDEGSFREVGSVTGFASYDDEGRVSAFTPSNHVGGRGTIATRPVVVCADDFTSRGGHADGAIGAKSGYLDRLSVQMRVPSIRLLDGSSGGGSVAAMVPEQRQEGESSAQESRGAIVAGRPRVSGGGGSFLPGHLGSTMFAEQLSKVPVVNMLLGSVVGIGAAKAVLGHFSVMVRDIAQLFVAGPPVVRHAMGYDIAKEDLGDWRVHCRNGSVDNLADSEEAAAALVRRFLSYLPSSVYEPPPVEAPDSGDPPDRHNPELRSLIPRRRTMTFDIRRAIELMADDGSFLEIGPLWGTDQVVGFVRFNGHPLGVLASDSRHVNGGAMTADGCRKLTRHLDLCDLFHIPILNLIDNPGFAVGLEHEVAGTIRAGGEWMVAFAQITVPIFTVVMRRSFGVAGNNFATPQAQASVRVAWPAADVGGIPPEGGIEAAYKRQLAEAADPEAFRAELNARIESARGPLGPLSRFQIEEMIDPAETRPMVCEWVQDAYRVVSQPASLAPRAIQFRP